ncbi:MAG: DUF4430 domain-containing protein [Candidatus Fimenecus sp.]
MKKNLNSKILLSVLALVLIAAMALGFAACGEKTPSYDTSAKNEQSSNAPSDTSAKNEQSSNSSSESATQIGQGEKAFTFEVTDKDGSKTVFNIKTDADTVGAALIENKLVSGTESEYGLMVDTVNGVKYDYTADKMYWAFYIDGDYAQTGVDSTKIENGKTYSFVATAA